VFSRFRDAPLLYDEVASPSDATAGDSLFLKWDRPGLDSVMPPQAVGLPVLRLLCYGTNEICLACLAGFAVP